MVLGESAAFRVPAINTGCVNMRKNALAPAGGVDPAETGAEAGRDKSSRWDHVLTLLATTKRLSVAEVSRTLGVSESTVRRAFMEMERAQLARRTHGGIVAIDMAYSLATAPRTTDEDGAQRERVAVQAASLIDPGQIVGFNGGQIGRAAGRGTGWVSARG